jgi:dihydropteroate synthase
LPLDGAPAVMGILNVTPDSFFDGGNFAAPEAAAAQAHRMVAEGATLIDVGGQSTRPGYDEVLPEEEIARIVPVVRRLVRELAVPVSIDTYKPAVARAALAEGAHVLNDVHGLQREPELATLAAKAGCAVIVMHQESGFRETGGDVIVRLGAFFARSLEIAAATGIERERVVLDPGIGFEKTREQNLEILARLEELRVLGRPLLLGVSRKSVIGLTLDLPPEERIEGTLATTALAVWQGVELIRVHDVQANVRAARMAHAIREVRFS